MEENAIKRVMPHNDEAEQSVIGALVLDNESIASVSDFLLPEDFYQKRYGIIYQAILDLYKEGKAADVVTIKSRLQEMNVPAEISNMTYFGELIANVPASSNARYYAQIVNEQATLRSLIRASEEITNNCYIGKETVPNILDETENSIFKILNQRRGSDYVPINQIAIDTLDKIRQASLTKNPITGLSTGFKDLDIMTTGLQNSNLIIVAARPSMGKTAFVLNVASYVTLKEDKAVALFSLEMSKEELVKRIIAMNARVDMQKISTGNLEDREMGDVIQSVGEVGRSKLVLDDTPGISIGELRTRCRKYKLDHDVKLIIIDYLQLMSGSAKNAENRQQEITEISRSLKALARELDIPIIALSQLSRGPEQRNDHRPIMADIRESGSIEQDADMIMFIYRDEVYNPETENKNEAEIIIGKQRNGPVGTVKLAWQPQYTKFVNLSKDIKG